MHGKHIIRAKRDAQALTQKVLGDIAGVSTSTISHIECHRGPDVPADQLRTTKTKLNTAIKLAAALSGRGPGVYTVEEFVQMQNLFNEVELYEAIVNQLERQERRRKRKQRHLRAVA